MRLLPFLMLPAAGLLAACGASPPRRPIPVFPSCEEAVRAVEMSDYRVPDVFPTPNCGNDYNAYKAYARTPSGKRCEIGYVCERAERIDP